MKKLKIFHLFGNAKKTDIICTEPLNHEKCEIDSNKKERKCLNASLLF